MIRNIILGVIIVTFIVPFVVIFWIITIRLIKDMVGENTDD